MKSILNKRKKIGNGLSAAAFMGTALMLAACGEKPQAPPLFQQEREALEKVKGVEQAGAKSAEDLKQEAEKQAQ